MAATNADGHYRFEGLCARDYKVVVDGSTLPAGVIPTNQMVGDPSQDSNGSPAMVTLESDDDVDLTIDFGFCEIIEDCEECDGKVTDLTLKNNGPEALIRVEQKKNNIVVFEEVVGNGAMFSFSGVDKKDTLILQRYKSSRNSRCARCGRQPRGWRPCGPTAAAVPGNTPKSSSRNWP